MAGSGGFAPKAWDTRKGKKAGSDRFGYSSRRPFKRVKRQKYWHQAQRGGWSFTSSTAVIEHRCSACGRVRFRREYDRTLFYRRKWDGSATILSKFKKGHSGTPLPIEDECRCCPSGRPSNRLLKLLAES